MKKKVTPLREFAAGNVDLLSPFKALQGCSAHPDPTNVGRLLNKKKNGQCRVGSEVRSKLSFYKYTTRGDGWSLVGHDDLNGRHSSS